MSVKRYEWVACDEHACHCDVVESAEGDMVNYEDYAALDQKLAESQREFRAADATIENLQIMKMALAKQLTIALQNLGAPVELLCIVGSYGDTQADADVLEMLEQYNQRGTCMDVIIAPEFTWKPNSGAAQ